MASIQQLCAMSVTEARDDRTYPPGTIGVASADLARYSSFSMALLGVKYPYGTTVTWRRGCDLVNHANKLAREMQGDWLWIMGDDHVFDANLLFRLLSRMYDDGCDLVAPLCLGRTPPYPTVIGVLDEANKMIGVKPLQDCGGLMKVDMVGSAGLLVRRRVFEAMADPWFEAGSISRTGLGEDWWFGIKAKRLGFQTHVDCDLLLGHTVINVVWPRLGATSVGATLDLDDGHHLTIDHVLAEPAA